MINLDEVIKLYEDKIEYDIMIIESAETMPHSSVDYRSLDEYRERLATDKQIVEWLKELKEAKRLLKKAVSGFRYLGAEWMDHEDRCTLDCSICPLHNGYNCSHWNMQDEALKLIGEDKNGT